ncbi:MAG: M3 family peptidase, partial [Hymenobacteraceae bacterium]|nr:M3 family peptidase [Hymenobacteraceae bacterium]MDX5513729.1 M3 family peptidase [Hymenobacteraceae bacterium]
MINKIIYSGKATGLAALLAVAGCTSTPPQQTAQQTQTATQAPPVAETNQLLKEWEGPYGGVPTFDKMKLEDLQPAIEKGMKLHLEDIDAIANNPAAPTFENTIVAMEKAGEELDRAFTYYGIWSSNLSSPEFRKIQAELSPKISEFNSKVLQNQKLFNRIKTVYENSQKSPLPADQQRVVQLIYEDFAMDGAGLDAAAKERYAAINKELASLYTAFSNNVLADEENYVTYITKDQLGGLPESFVKAAAKAAADRGHEGEYAILNTRSSMDQF